MNRASAAGPTTFADISGAPNEPLSTQSIRFIGGAGLSQNDAPTKAASGSTSMLIMGYPYWINQLYWRTGNQAPYDTMLSVVDNLRYGSNSAAPGSTLANVLTATPSLAAILATMEETHMFCYLGTGDLNAANMTLATAVARWEAVNDLILSYGKFPIWATVLPRNSTDGANDWADTTPTRAQRRKMVAAFNLYMIEHCKELGLICVKWHHRIMAANGDAITGYTSDGMHPNAVGSEPLQDEVFNTIGHLFPAGGAYRDIYEAYDATWCPRGNPLNGAFTLTTGGAVSDAGGAGTLPAAAEVPDGWRLTKVNSTTTDCAISLVDRTDGDPGSVLEVTLTTKGTGGATDKWRLEYWNGATVNLADYAVSGDYIQMGTELEFRAGHGTIGKGVGVWVQNEAEVTTGAIATVSFDAATKQIRDSANGFGSFNPNRLAVVSGAGEAGNNAVFPIESVTAGVLQLPDDVVLTDEAAGATVTVLIPMMGTGTLGAATTIVPDVDTPVMYEKSPIMQMPFTGDLLPYLQFGANGTQTGTVVYRFANPWLRKLETLPSVCEFEADDKS